MLNNNIETEITDVPSFLKDTLTEDFLYLPNPGNAGDAIMAKSTYDLFEKLNLRYHSLEHSDLADSNLSQDRIVVLGGGGNFAEGGYNNYAKLLKTIHKHAKLVIILPHTIHGNTDLLSQLGSNVVLFCRERISYAHVKQHAPHAKVFLAHDMAFLLDVKSALLYRSHYLKGACFKILYKLTHDPRHRSMPSLHNYWQGLTSKIRFSNQKRSSETATNLFRTDIEKTEIQTPKGNIDASLVFNFGVTSPIKSDFTVHHLLKFLEKTETINTNRLHIAIAAALLGKRVNFSSNNYFKCRAVYEHSLQKQFPNVKWID